MSLGDLKTQEILQKLLSQKHSGSEFTIKKETAIKSELVADFQLYLYIILSAGQENLMQDCKP